jgi:hypothetical protein
VSSVAATPIDRATKLALVSTAAGHQAEAGGNAGAAFTDGLQTTLRVSGVLSLIGLLIPTVFVGRGMPTTVSTPQPTGGIT